MKNHNPWHSVDPDVDNCQVNALIEISNGSRAKYELDKETGLLRLDRVLYLPYYPANYDLFRVRMPKMMTRWMYLFCHR